MFDLLFLYLFLIKRRPFCRHYRPFWLRFLFGIADYLLFFTFLRLNLLTNRCKSSRFNDALRLDHILLGLINFSLDYFLLLDFNRLIFEDIRRLRW